jgi:two-component system, chemotaxis family, protein-glutamate methylesterase/glutaminase
MEEENVSSSRRIIIIGGSAGSLQAIFRLFKGIAEINHIAIIIIIHRSQGAEQGLEEIISLKTGLPVKEIEEKEVPKNGTLYIGPPDYHVLFEKDESFALDYSEKVNFCRPSIDVTFQSAADVFGSSVICILLSGANSDGADGLAYVQGKKGIAIVQNPEDAEVPYMPLQAIHRNNADHIFNMDEIRSFIENLR